MNIIQAVILGLVEGITEFLPISSTAHLILTSKILGIAQSEFISFFEVGIQSGAILAVIILYWRYMLKHMKLAPYLIASFVPTAIVGLLMHDVIKRVFFGSTTIISMALIGFGLVFILVEWVLKDKKVNLSKKIEKMTYRDAVLIGLFQSLAIVPGVSRAGAVIVGMIGMKYDRSESAQYSFLLAIPTILAASLLDFVKTDRSLFTSNNIMILLVGGVTAFISAWFCIKWLITYLQKHTLTNFGVYRIIIGLLALILL